MSCGRRQHVQELDRRALRELHVGLHAAAGIDHQAQVHRRRGVAVALREVVDRLLLAVLDDLEIVLREIGDDVALSVGDGRGKRGEIDAGAEHGLGPASKNEEQSTKNERAKTALLLFVVLRSSCLPSGMANSTQRYNPRIVRCLAVCHTELVVRLLEAVLTPSAELDVLVESRALARKFESSELPVSVDETDRIDSYVKLGVSPVMPVFIEDNGRRGLRKVLEAVRGAGGTLDLRPRHQPRRRQKGRDAPRRFPRSHDAHARRAGRAAAPDRARPLRHPPARPAVSALHGRCRSRADPDAQRS